MPTNGQPPGTGEPGTWDADDCARAELLIAAGADSPLPDDDAGFLRAHLARCRPCRETALEPPAGQALDLPAVAPDNYAIGAEIGRGGMGRVLCARDLRIGRAVALKEMLGQHAYARARFEREARITARLQHPGIVSVYEVGCWPDGRPFYAMPILSGRTLHEAIAAAPGPRERLHLLPSLIAAADAVAYAHSLRIIHRDLTPSNILLGSFGETIVIDWGIAKDLDEEPELELGQGQGGAGTYPSTPGGAARLTATGAVIGTPAYSAPEQASGRAVDQRADVYSLGAMLYQLLTGRPPAAAALPSGAPRDLHSVARKALATDPSDRYPTAAELVEDLRRHRNGERVRAHAYTGRELAGRWLSRRVGLVVGLTITLALVAAAAIAGSAALARAQRDTQKALTEAQLNLAEGLLQAATALKLAGKWGEARARYGEAEAAFARVGTARLSTTLGLLESHQRAPAPLMTMTTTMAMATGPQPITALAATPDGRRAVAAQGGQLKLWDPIAGRLLRSFAHVPSPEMIRALVLSADGKLAVSGADDGKVTAWDVASGRPLRQFVGHDQYVMALALSADGRRLLSAGGGGQIRVWDVASGRQVGTLATGTMFVDVLAIDPQGRLVVSGGFHELAVWDLAAGRRLRAAPQNPLERIKSLAITGDGARLLAGGRAGTLELHELRSGRLLRKFAGHRMGVDSLALSADARLAVSGSRDGELKVWDLARDDALHTIVGPAGDLTVALSADGQRVLMGGADGVLRLARAVPQWNRGLLPHPRAVVQVSLSPDGRLVLAADAAGRVFLLDVGTGRELQVLAGEGAPVSAVGLSADGQRALWSTSRAVHIWDLQAARELKSLSVATSGAPVFSADGRRFLGGQAPGADGPEEFQLGWWDLERPDQTRIIKIGGDAVRGTVLATAIAGNGTRGVAADATGFLTIWNMGATDIQRWQSPVSTNFTVDMSEHGRFVLSADASTVRLWAADTGALVRSFLHQQDKIGLVRFWSGQDLMLSAGQATLKVWELSGSEVHTFATDSPVAALSAYDRTLAAGLAGGVGLYDLDLPARHRRLEGRLADAHRTLDRDPADAAALATLGEWYLDRGEWDLAAELLERAQAGGARVSALGLARAHWQAGRLAAAGRQLRAALAAAEAPAQYLKLCLRAVEGPPAPGYSGADAATRR